MQKFLKNGIFAVMKSYYIDKYKLIPLSSVEDPIMLIFVNPDDYDWDVKSLQIDSVLYTPEHCYYSIVNSSVDGGMEDMEIYGSMASFTSGFSWIVREIETMTTDRMFGNSYPYLKDPHDPINEDYS